MTIADMNRARLISTALGGLCWIPSAVLRRESTTTIRTNEVVMMTMDGARDRTVSRPINWTTLWVRPAPVPRSMFTAWARAAAGKMRPIAPAMRASRAAWRRSALSSAILRVLFSALDMLRPPASGPAG